MALLFDKVKGYATNARNHKKRENDQSRRKERSVMRGWMKGKDVRHHN